MLTVVVATYQRYDILSECLSALQRQTLDSGDFEVLVVDNSPDEDASLSFGERYANAKGLRWIHQHVRGLSAARNRGIRESRHPLIAFLDDDAIADPAWAKEIVEAFDLFGERVAAVGGRIDLGWRTPRPQWLHPSLHKFLTTVDHGSERRLLNGSEEIAGANMSFRKSVFTEHGFFSESLGRKGSSTLLSNEDTRLFKALHEAGYAIAYAPLARVEHIVDPSRLVQSWFRKRIAWQAASDMLDQPEMLLSELENHWRWLGDYYQHVPPSERNLRGLLVDCSDAEQFARQINAVYNATACLLGAYAPESQ